tara:strand:+ start:287 stop:712 length:426 start_codon:yes stop_codon:yes gene_type:complete
MSREQLLYKMRDALEMVNIFYSGSSELTPSEQRVFKETTKVLAEAEEAIGGKMIVEGVDISKIDTWRKHIYTKFDRLCADYGYQARVIRSPNRSRELVDVRQKIAKTLFADGKGFNKTQISWALNRDVSSVRALINHRKAA